MLATLIITLLFYIALNVTSTIQLKKLQSELPSTKIKRPYKLFQAFIYFLAIINSYYIIGLIFNYDPESRTHIFLIISLLFLNIFPQIIISQSKSFIKEISKLIKHNQNLLEKTQDQNKKLKIILEEHRKISEDYKQQLEDMLTLRQSFNEQTKKGEVLKENQKIENTIKKINKRLNTTE